MSRRRTAYYYMTPDERREYHRIHQREYRERIAALEGRIIVPRNPYSHPTKMSYEERREYYRQQQRRYKERHGLLRAKND